jgi:hypothetical protein
METRNERLTELFNGYKLLNDYIDFDEVLRYNECNALDELNEAIQDRINEADIVYYASAMEFLTENDISLRESLQIAQDFGFEPKNLSSEALASLLLQNMLSEELSEFINEVENEEIFKD